MSLLSKGGVIGRITGVDEARRIPGVLCIDQRFDEGDTIPITLSQGQMHFWIYMVADDEEGIKEIVRQINHTICVYDDRGQKMLYADFDPERLHYSI